MFFDETNNYFDDYESNNNTIIFNTGNNLYTLEEGFNKGNMFQDLYSSYKNHVYKLKVNSPKDELLYKIQMYNFALKDLNLYLDVNPNDNSMLNEFNKLKVKFMEYKTKYDNSFGPLCVLDVNSDSAWDWINNPWPWDKGGK